MVDRGNVFPLPLKAMLSFRNKVMSEKNATLVWGTGLEFLMRPVSKDFGLDLNLRQRCWTVVAFSPIPQNQCCLSGKNNE